MPPPPGTECAPIAIAPTGWIVTIDPSTLSVTLSAAELNAGSIDACGTGSLSFAIKRHGDSAAIPAESLTFYPEDEGYSGVEVELWVSDGVHSAMVTTTVYVENTQALI